MLQRRVALYVSFEEVWVAAGCSVCGGLLHRRSALCVFLGDGVGRCYLLAKSLDAVDVAAIVHRHVLQMWRWMIVPHVAVVATIMVASKCS